MSGAPGTNKLKIKVIEKEIMLLLLWCVGQLSILSAVAGNVARHQNTIYTVFSLTGLCLLQSPISAQMLQQRQNIIRRGALP